MIKKLNLVLHERTLIANFIDIYNYQNMSKRGWNINDVNDLDLELNEDQDQVF